MTTLELENVQGFITFGYGHLEYSAYLFLHLDDGARGRQWLAQVTPEVTPARTEKGTQAVHVALTFPGLAKLGLPEDGLGTFPRQFQEGMTAPDRARILGDEGDEAPERWLVGGPSTDEVHVLLMLFAHTSEAREVLVNRHEAALAEIGGVRVVWRESSERPIKNEEHFGFRDGLSQPAIDGAPAKPKPGQTVMPPGEFILGYPNAYGEIPFAPTVAPDTDPSGLLGPDPNDPTRRSLGANGTYVVFRKLRQDVPAFWRYFHDQAAASGQADPRAEAVRLAAKSVGRWRSGASLTLSPDHDNGQPDNDFGYRATDPVGMQCPIGAHVRRNNPPRHAGPGHDRQLRDHQPPPPAAARTSLRPLPVRPGECRGRRRGSGPALPGRQRQPAPSVRVHPADLGERSNVRRPDDGPRPRAW